MKALTIILLSWLVTWQPATPPDDYTYDLERRDSIGGDWHTVHTTTDSTYHDTTGVRGKRVFYRLQTHLGDLHGPPSNVTTGLYLDYGQGAEVVTDYTSYRGVNDSICLSIDLPDAGEHWSVSWAYEVDYEAVLVRCNFDYNESGMVDLPDFAVFGLWWEGAAGDSTRLQEFARFGNVFHKQVAFDYTKEWE